MYFITIWHDVFTGIAKKLKERFFYTPLLVVNRYLILSYRPLKIFPFLLVASWSQRSDGREDKVVPSVAKDEGDCGGAEGRSEDLASLKHSHIFW